MIFPPDALELIQARRKSQDSRPRELVRPANNGTPAKYRPCPVKVGRVYSAQPRQGARGQFDLTIFDIRAQRLGEMTERDARREGFAYVSQFMLHWEQTHGRFDPDASVWVISFEVGDHASEFDRPRLLASGPGHVDYEVDERGRHRWPADDDTDDDYTDQLGRGLPREPEALTDRQLAPYVAAGQLRDRARAAQTAIDRPLIERIRDLERRAAAGDCQAQRALFAVRQKVERVERRLDQNAA